jgi:hypothetical protein
VLVSAALLIQLVQLSWLFLFLHWSSDEHEPKDEAGCNVVVGRGSDRYLMKKRTNWKTRKRKKRKKKRKRKRKAK